MFNLILASYFLIYFCILGVYCQNPEVETLQGIVSGGRRSNIDGNLYYCFKRIPYAKPPTGTLRFKAPQPPDSWEGLRDATVDFRACIQEGAAQLGGAAGQEDCLYLNVYTPGLPEENVTDLAVMVWIHGGRFRSGSGMEIMFGANYILSADVVLVTVNYRVGIFGFLSLDDPDLGVTGNAGLKDLVLALEWVRDNIEFFGGDPNNVLIFGEGTGGMSVQLLLLSPMASGLFHKAISQSGDATTGLLDPITRNNAVAIAEQLGIQTDNWENMLTSLQSQSASNLATAEKSFDTTYYKFFAGPIVEISATGTFLESRPIDIIRSGNYNQVPFIIGTTDAEGLLFNTLSRTTIGESILIEDFADFIPDEFNVTDAVLEELVAYIIKFFYYGTAQPSRNNVTAAVELTSDFAFVFPSYRSTMEYLNTAENPIYFYRFTAITDLNFDNDTYAAYPGAAHGDDIPYLFFTPNSPNNIRNGTAYDSVIRSIVSLWTNFAIYGDPTPEDLSDFVWEPVTQSQFNYVEIGTEGTVSVLNSLFTQDRIEFWVALYEEYAQGSN